jgi:hypothetical protein
MAAQSLAEQETRERFTPRPINFNRRTFEAWQIGESGYVQSRPVFDHESADAIAASYACEGSFGETLAVRETDSIAGTATLHFYRVRRGKWLGRYSRDGERKEYPFYADPLFKLNVKAFDPVEPWRYTRGCDVVGRDPNVIDASSADAVGGEV